MKGIRWVFSKGVFSNINFLQIAFLAFLILGSTVSSAQSSLNLDVNDNSQNGQIAQVNINLADAETIAAVLDGVGLNRAEAIVDYRESNGDFKAVDDLIMVSGIGEVTLRNNADKILLVSD